ncbi:hypothetical protein MOV08_09630 [Streptomyces yunnanensis]|uniref:PknH-like extracellular domain-containing protein n=1 Tax=Streptomyces yunnanensis TaxID=156453 RepID=A0ABY8A3H0_9ACTN|nr:hypothetical protein [Streptomyces yunnanensis]WEB39505.1 hypothetical protein MOV08_09630 [Streptomyces yunnanensis]
MDRSSSPPRYVAAVLAAGVLVATAACSGGGPSGSATKSASPSAQLTGGQAEASLISPSALGAQWNPAAGGGTGRQDALLRSKANKADCQTLLERLRSGNLIGATPTAKATEAFTEPSRNARMTYQVAAFSQADAVKGMAWLKTLPNVCDGFTAVDPSGNKAIAQVVQTSLPKAGDDRFGVRMSMVTTVQGLKTTLALEAAAARIGPNAVSVTNGGLGGAGHADTRQAIQSGAQRLQKVLAGQTPQG